jgi:hypothetical protein
MVKFVAIDHSSSKAILVTEAYITTWMTLASRNGNTQSAGSAFDISSNC